MKKSIPNYITCFRILGAIVMLFLKPFSVAFFVVYSVCGVSDLLDGYIARSTKTTSDLGARLDSIADLTFYAVMFLKIFPALIATLPIWLWCMVGVVLALRGSAYLVAAIKYKRFASLHTVMNKLSGLAVFCIPYIIQLSFAVHYCLATAIITGTASFEELLLHITNNDYGKASSLRKK